LDYGCGPGPTLSVLFKEKGFDMKNYDPFFFNEPNFLTIPYDFITCTEAIEHFSDPLKEIRLLVSLLKKGGWLAIKTETWARLIKFRTWYYRKDPTHVIFFSEKTFGWISGKFHLNLEKHPKSVFLLQKN
jgi:2-polyprenyl-3-methyl-5-hydroxy-6-metoxy-1,4-benzoquinol methylase